MFHTNFVGKESLSLDLCIPKVKEARKEGGREGGETKISSFCGQKRQGHSVQANHSGYTFSRACRIQDCVLLLCWNRHRSRHEKVTRVALLTEMR